MSRRTDAVEAVEDGSLLHLTVSPGASSSRIDGLDEWRAAVRVKVAARPVDGEANAELIRFLAEALSVPEGRVSIVKGSKGHRKAVFVPLTVEDVIMRLGLV